MSTKEEEIFGAAWRAIGALSVAMAHFGTLTTQTKIEPEQRAEAECICRENMRKALDELGSIKMPQGVS